MGNLIEMALIYFIFCMIVLLIMIPLLTIYSFYKKKYSVAMIGVVICLSIILVFVNTRFYKERKRVDTDWFYGQTIEEVNKRYLPYTDNGKYLALEERICITREVFYWDFWDGEKGDYLYAVKLDEDGKIAEVNKVERRGRFYVRESSYWNHWGIIP